MSYIKIFKDQVATVRRIISAHGGLYNALGVLHRTDDLRDGKLIGEDQFGNKYYENTYYFKGSDRWVIYNKKHYQDYDGSMIPAEWYGWMHHKVDEPPTVKKPIHYEWMADHTVNPSGTKNAYVPYSTTKPKIQAWTPPSKTK